MMAKLKYEGLCSTCIHDEDCTFARSPASPITHCEEFDAGPPARGRKRTPSQGTGTPPRLNEGICLTCNHREDCAFPRARKGVQRCEEYA